MINQTMCSSFKVQMLNGIQNFSADTFKIALYYSTANLNSTTTTYTTTGEIVSSGYTAGGIVLTVNPVPTLSGTTAYVSFDNAVFGASLTARGALIYNASKANSAVIVLDFGADKTMQNFTVVFPAATSTSAILRIG